MAVKFTNTAQADEAIKLNLPSELEALILRNPQNAAGDETLRMLRNAAEVHAIASLAAASYDRPDFADWRNFAREDRRGLIALAQVRVEITNRLAATDVHIDTHRPDPLAVALEGAYPNAALAAAAERRYSQTRASKEAK
jgi:hypothetical protein